MSGQLVHLPSRAPVILTKRQLAAHLGRSERWIELKVRDEKMPCLEATDRLGRRRFDLVAVEEWLRGGRPKRRRSDHDRLDALEREMASLRAELADLRRTG